MESLQHNINYRGFIISPEFIYHDPFTKVPTGKFDGMWYEDEDGETANSIIFETLEDVKARIDEHIFERTEYRVINKTGITKFSFVSDAIAFINQFGGELKVLVGYTEIQFDSI